MKCFDRRVTKPLVTLMKIGFNTGVGNGKDRTGDGSSRPLINAIFKWSFEKCFQKIFHKETCW